MIRSIRERRAQSVSGVSAASDSAVDTVTTGAAVPGRISLTSRDGLCAPIERSIPSREEKPAAREHGDRVFAALAGPGASEDDDHSASAPATATMTKAEVMTRAELQAVIDKHLTIQSAAANATNDDEHHRDDRERAARENPARDDDLPSPPPVGFFDVTLQDPVASRRAAGRLRARGALFARERPSRALLGVPTRSRRRSRCL